MSKATIAQMPIKPAEACVIGMEFEIKPITPITPFRMGYKASMADLPFRIPADQRIPAAPYGPGNWWVPPGAGMAPYHDAVSPVKNR